MPVHDRLAIDVQSAQELKYQVASGGKEGLRRAAEKFESMMLAMVMKNMRETRFSEEDDPLTRGEGMQLYQDLLDQQWAERVSSAGGVGFAEMIVKSVEKTLPPPPEKSPL